MEKVKTFQKMFSSGHFSRLVSGCDAALVNISFLYKDLIFGLNSRFVSGVET